MRKVIYILIFLLLSSCSSDEPIKIPDDKSYYFGVWEYKSEEYGKNVKTDKMLLAFHRDSTVSYKRCIKTLGGHNNSTVSEATIVKLTDKELVINANLIIIGWNLEFAIEKPPYQEEGEWMMKVDGALLRKLKPGEKSDHETWDCGKKQKKDDDRSIQ